jgi:hypothetical protein
MRKMLRNPAVRMICWYLAFTLSGFFILPVTAQAGFISPSEGTLAEMDVDAIAVVREALEEGILTEKLTALGLSADEIKARLDALTPDERQAVLADMEQIQAGGDSLVTLLVIVALVLLILHLMGKKVKIE